MTSSLPLPDHALRPGEPLAEGIVRILGHGFDRIDQSLVEAPDGIDVGIHTTRKTIKRIRAVLRLVREGIGRDTHRLLNRSLRDAARRLSPARDSFVLVQTLDSTTAGTAIDATDLRTWLVERHDAERSTVVDGNVIPLVVHDLLVVRGLAEAGAASLSGDAADTFPAPLLEDLRRTYRRGRNAFGAAVSRDPESLHEWRKRVKYLRHQCEALEGVAPITMRVRVPRLDTLGELLGDHHDRVVLHEVVGDAPQGVADSVDIAALAVAIRTAEDGLADQALDMGPDLYRMTPQTFSEWVASDGRS